MAGAVRRIGVQERRARLGVRHHLAPAARAAGVVQVAEDLVGLHGTDPASVFLAAAARMRQPEVGAIERALYHDRVLLRMLGMRRTMFVVPVELAPIVQAACTNAIAAAQRRLLLQLLEQSGIAADDPERWLEEVEEATVKALAARGQALASELAEDEPRLREQILLAEGKSYAARQSVVTRVLLVLAAEGRIARGRPRGSWISGQYRWSLIESWLPGGMAGWSTEAAQAELVRRWLAAFGPGTVADLRWWTGLTAGQVKRALAAVGAVEVDLDGVPGLVLAGDLAPLAAPEPWVALLPALDPTVMGWSGRGWYLGDHGPTLFDRNGNAGPTVWWDGRVVGGWASRKDGEIAVRLLEDVGADAAAAVEAAAGGLADWLGPVRVTPRFRTPLERDLSA
jgi:Winged helix DNA-binding domain